MSDLTPRQRDTLASLFARSYAAKERVWTFKVDGRIANALVHDGYAETGLHGWRITPKGVDKYLRLMDIDPETGKRRPNPPIDFRSVNLRQKYDEFNRKYFDGSLPQDIELRFNRMRDATGKAHCRTPPGWRGKAYWGLPVEGCYEFRILMSTLLQYDDAEFDRFFLHEMIHIWFYVHGNVTEAHGGSFIAKAKEIGQKSGLEIPLRHEYRGDEKVNAKPRLTGVLTFTHSQHGPLVALFHPHSTLVFLAYAQRAANSLGRDSAIYLLPTKAHALTKVHKSIPRGGLPFTRLTALIARELNLEHQTPKFVVKPGGAT